MKYSVLPTTLFWVASAGLLLSSLTYVSARAILGIDLGSIYMKVALVQRGAPLEIVTNMHSKRKTEQMILFDQGARLYGSDANSLLARKPTKVPLGMSVMLGRDDDHPAVKVRNRICGTQSKNMSMKRKIFVSRNSIMQSRQFSSLMISIFIFLTIAFRF